MNTSSTCRTLLGVAVTAVLTVLAAACGSDEPAASGGEAPGGAAGDAAAAAVQRGEEISRTRGCAGCHGQDFDGGAGPSWVGLAGSEVVLADGSTLVADEAYLVRSIAEPSADLLEGYSLQMPANNLSDAEIDDVVAFITSLAGDGSDDG